MTLDLSTALQLAGPLVTAGLVWGSIRAELLSLRALVTELRVEIKDLGAKHIGQATTDAVHGARLDTLEHHAASLETALTALQTRVNLLERPSHPSPR